MTDIYIINYKDLNKYYEEFLYYVIGNSDLFSLITYLEESDSQKIFKFAYEDKLQSIQSYLKHQIIGIKRWSNAGTRDNNKVMNIYSCDDSIINTIKTLGNFLFPEKDDLPEDICFYKGNTIWISTVSHEEFAFIYFPSDSDLQFFKKNKIRYYPESPMSIYKLPI